MTVTIEPKIQLEMGKRLREIRERKQLSQEDIAKATGMSSTYYAGIERGEENPTLAILYSLCKALKVKSSEFQPF